MARRQFLVVLLAVLSVRNSCIRGVAIPSGLFAVNLNACGPFGQPILQLCSCYVEACTHCQRSTHAKAPHGKTMRLTGLRRHQADSHSLYFEHMRPCSRRLFCLQVHPPQAARWLLQDRTSSKSGPMLRRSMAGPCASLACGATSAVMRLVASLLMSISSSSDTPCAASQMFILIQALRSKSHASRALT